MQVALGVVFAAAVALAAYRVRALSLDGALAAFAIGATVFGATGWRGAAILFAFFIPAALLSRRGTQTRNAWQVLANGSVAVICALIASKGFVAFAAAFGGAFATAAADTWGTEIGVRWGRTPVSILTFRPVTVGQSGGVTLVGSLATVAGACCVAIVAAAVGFGSFVTVALGGVVGALVDSVLGASLQSLRWCPACRVDCETRRHDCGTVTTPARGFGWMENDAVNFVATLSGAVVALLLNLRAP
jgi:uncharacterized protein (TIGR00297 family)